MNLIKRLDNIIPEEGTNSEDYHIIKRQLERIEEIDHIVAIDSLASDGMLMIESALRDQNNRLDT